MKVSDQTDLSCAAGLPAKSIIEAAAIIEATAIVRMAMGLHTTPRGATPILNANAVILNKGPIPGILPTHIHPGDVAMGLHTTPRGATPILNANAVILNKGPIPGILPTHIHPGDVLTGPDLHPDPVRGADPILAAEPD